MAAVYDKTSFGIQRRRHDAEQLNVVRKAAVERMTFTTDVAKLERLANLIDAVDEVLEDLTD